MHLPFSGIRSKFNDLFHFWHLRTFSLANYNINILYINSVEFFLREVPYTWVKIRVKSEISRLILLILLIDNQRQGRILYRIV